MHEQIAFLKRAVTRGDTMGVLNCYVVKDGQVMARDGSIQAGAPFPALVVDDFNVPAGELEAILNRVKTDAEVTHADGVVTVRGKRLKVDVACIVDEPPAVTLPEDGWRPLPTGLVPALKLASTFVMDKLQNFGVRLMGDRVTVISSRGGIDVEVQGLDARECCVSLPCADFLTAQADEPFEWHQSADAVAFRWTDGRWLRAQLLQRQFPKTVEAIFTAAGSDCPVEITAEWRDAYEDVAALADDVIELHADKLVAIKATSKVESDIKTAVEGVSHWSTRGLDPVMAIATHWNPAAWPKPATFKGPNFRGVVVGVSAS